MANVDFRQSGLYAYVDCSIRPSQGDADHGAVLGYLLGPTVGSALHSLTHPALARGSPSPLEVMDRAFFEHLKKNRVSPAFQSANNPTPDYYGEKVRRQCFYEYRD